MKFFKFLKKVLDDLDNARLDIRTAKYIIRLMNDCLSNSEREKYGVIFSKIYNEVRYQTTIHDSIRRNKINELEKELEQIKSD